MIVKYTNSFVKDIKNIKDKKLLNQLKEFIETVKSKPNLKSIPNVKQLKGFKNYYRSKISDYRIGMEIKRNNVTFVRFLHRKDIYRYFPITY